MEVIPMDELGRPRIDVTVRISGFFRDAFPNLINLLDQAVELAASLDETAKDNMIVKHLTEDGHSSQERPSGEIGTSGPGEDSRPASLYRIFGS